MAGRRGLMDHFRPPLHPARKWQGFQAAWVCSIAANINLSTLPERCFAEVRVAIGRHISDDHEAPSIATTVVPNAYLPPAPMAIVPAIFPDSVEVLIYHERDALLAAVVELICPGNKDNPANRRSFVARCVAYLQQGVGVLLIDVVTNRVENLHRDLTTFFGGRCRMSHQTNLYACSYRPVRRENDEHLEVWTFPLAIGAALPIVPLALRHGPIVPVDLGAAYQEACRSLRLPVDCE